MWGELPSSIGMGDILSQILFFFSVVWEREGGERVMWRRGEREGGGGPNTEVETYFFGMLSGNFGAEQDVYKKCQGDDRQF